MNGIEVRTFDLTEVIFYAFARRYPSVDEAKRVWDALVEVSTEEAARRNLAGYRIEWQGEQNVVAIVGHVSETIAETALQIGGEPIELDDNVYKALVARRLRWLAAAQALEIPSGVHVGLGKVMLNDDGEVVG